MTPQIRTSVCALDCPDTCSLLVQIDDDGRGTESPASDGGNGLSGMRERTQALGGTITAGPRAEGGFRVRAFLPAARVAAAAADADAASAPAEVADR